MAQRRITSIQMLISEVWDAYKAWGTSTTPWFRGEPREIRTPLLPKLVRGGDFNPEVENQLLQHFRMKAPSLGLPYVPAREYTDQWLFLAQHVRLPTRLLDWTEGLLIATFFAINTRAKGAVVWMLDPLELNRKTVPHAEFEEFGLTWFSRRRAPLRQEDLEIIQGMIKSKGIGQIDPPLKENIMNLNIHDAWIKRSVGTKFPIAVHPTNIHPRMSSQISRFTIHGVDMRSMVAMRLGSRTLRKFVISDRNIARIKEELRILGIRNSTLFPELDGLSDELSELFMSRVQIQ